MLLRVTSTRSVRTDLTNSKIFNSNNSNFLQKIDRYFSSLTVGVGSNGRVQSFISNEFVDIQGDRTADVVSNPATQEVLARTPEMNPSQIDIAVAAAKSAFPAWRETPISKRMRFLIKLEESIRSNIDELSQILTAEQGKTLADSLGDITRGLDVVENMISAPNVLTGSTLSNVANSIDSSSYRCPLGVCVGISPFNFPAMIPLWMFPTALVAGNTFVLKPSARVPLTTMKLAQICRDIGLPPGVLNIVVRSTEYL